MRNIIRDSRSLSPAITNDIFGQKGNTPYNLRKIFEFTRPLVESVYQGCKSVTFLGPKIWDMILDDCKDMDILNTFKNNVKMESWKLSLQAL